MDLKDQVCSLDLAKRLKELGVKQESVFAWYGRALLPVQEELEVRAPAEMGISAFTVAELGEILYAKDIREFPYIEDYSHLDGECWKFVNPFSEFARAVVVLDTATRMSEADARARMLIYLLENKLIPTV